MPFQRPFVCIDDDAPSVLAALARLLRAADLDVETFETGEAFVRALADRPPDCAIVDIHLPSMDGFAVRDAIRSRDAGLPIVFVTAHEGRSIDRRVSEDPKTVLLRKPFPADRLIRAIVDSVTEHELIRANQSSQQEEA